MSEPLNDNLTTGETLHKIGQAADLLGVKPFVLRFWEGEFEQLTPERSSTGQRMYSEAHIALLKRIKTLLYDEGLTIEGARKRLEDDGRESVLEEIADELEAILRTLQNGEGA